MLAARRLQNGCPSCTAQILRLYIHSIADIAPAAAARRTTRHFTSAPRLGGRRSDSRLLSTSSKRLQDRSSENTTTSEGPDQASNGPAGPVRFTGPTKKRLKRLAAASEEHQLEKAAEEEEDDEDDWPATQDPESVVRQAKYLFGDSLPPGYLSDDEYKLYERFYGAPLRQTAPEDVGFGSFGEGEEDGPSFELKKQPQNALLREDEDGNLEEVTYVAEQNTAAIEVDEDGEAILVDKKGVIMAERPPNDAQIDYIEANARNQREYNALLRLQKDFEAARLRTVREDQEMKKKAAEEEMAAQEDELIEDEDIDEEDEDDERADARLNRDMDADRSRLHEYTIEGVFRTKPRTLLLPKERFVEPITQLLRRTDTKHIRDAGEKALGGKGFPHGPATPVFANSMPQRGIGLEAGHHRMSEINADAFLGTSMPGIYASVMGTLVEVRKRLGPEWLRGLLSRKDGEDGENVGPRVLDAGAGGAGLAAWNEVAQAEWDLMREKDRSLSAHPPGRKSVVVGSPQLRHRISRFLNDTQFLPRLPQYSFVENSHKQLDAPEVQQKRKVYDVIIAPHTLLPLDREFKRRDLLENLWSLLSPDGGVLIVLEKGHPRGFEAVAEVRQRLLDEFILAPTMMPRSPFTVPEDLPRVREPGMIIAPCTNHVKCPMYQTSGVSPGRKDFCHFSQRFTRPQFLQRVLGESSRNYEDINFSFLAIRRGMPADPYTNPSTTAQPTRIPQGEAATMAALKGYEKKPTTKSSSSSTSTRPHPLSLPRNILPPLKRKGHVTLDLCTPSGTIERWTVPKSHSRQAYHDARKARWGDLWALGAKTRVRRTVRLGRGYKEGEAVPNDGGVRAARAAAMNGLEPTKKGKSGLGGGLKGGGAKKPKLRVVEIGMNERGAFTERVKGLQGRRPERRTKGGRLPPREKNLVRLEED